MNIHALDQAGRADKSRKVEASKAAGKAEKLPPRRPDSVELSSKNSSNIVLDSIRAKIKSGFYNSESVADDVSDKLAGLFDRGL